MLKEIRSIFYNKYVTMKWTIEYPYEDVQRFILDLPPGLSVRYIRLTELMLNFGSNIGMPHTRAMSDGLFELRVKGREGIARMFYCTQVGGRIMMLHGFVKNLRRLPKKNCALPNIV